MASSADGAATARVPVFDIAALRAADRDLRGQFLLRLPSGDVECEAVLRWLPGRRAVLLARDRDSGQYVLKLYLRGAGRALRSERDGLMALAAAGFAVPELRLEQQFDGDAGMQRLTYIDGALTLVELWPRFDDATRRHWLCKLAAGIARLHEACARPLDPHLGNFMLHGAGSADARLFALDGGGVGIHSRMPSPAERIADLALLHAQLPPDDDAWARGTASAYAEMADTAPDVHTLLHAIDSARARRLRLILRKAMRDCSEFAVHRDAWGWTVQVRARVPQLRGLLAAPDRAIAEGETLKAGNTATVARVRADDGTRWVCKRYNIKGAMHRLSRAWRRTRGEHSWLAAQRLAALGIETAMPVALQVERTGPFRGRAFLWMRNVEGVGLDELVRDGQVNEALRARVAQLLVRLHAAGLVHGDLKASNLLVENGAPVLVDLDALVPLPPGARRERAQAKDRARFLANWTDPGEREAWHAALDAAEQALRERGSNGERADQPASAPERTRGER